MAIFIASTKSISRGKGQSAVACASYRAGVELEDKRYGKTHDYSKRHGVMSADIILPTKLAVTEAVIDRSTLWNRAEAAEKRKDARVAREWLVNLPHELSEADRRTIAHKFAQVLADRYGTIADCAIHKPTQKEIDRGADPRNYHAHILLTTRCAQIDDNFEITLTDKATIELSDNHRRKLGLERVSVEIKEVRQLWEQIANEKLFEHHHPLIDSRSYRDQGIDIIPQVKMGVDATYLERRTGETSIRGDLNRLIAARNELVWQKTLEHNQSINNAADAVILHGHRLKPTQPSQDLKTSALCPSAASETPMNSQRLQNTVNPKPKPLNQAAVAQALAMAKSIQTRRDLEKQQQERLAKQQREEYLAEKRKLEIAERERREQEHVKQQQREQQQFLDAKKAIYQSAITQITPTLPQKINPQSPSGKPIATISIASHAITQLSRYQSLTTTTPTQHRLADTERSNLIDLINDTAHQALDEIKQLKSTHDRKTHSEALQAALNEFIGHHSQTLSKTQQRASERAQSDINHYHQSLNPSRSYGLGR